MGTYLTGASGRAVYLWVADHSGKSSCAGACAKVWRPVLAKAMPHAASGVTSAMPHAASGVTSADLSLIGRSDGSRQVAYEGHPLYYFVEDTSAGLTKGQGTSSFGAKWWLVAPSGAGITKTASSSASSSSTSTSSGSSGWG